MKLIYQVEDKPKFPQLIVFALQQLLAIMTATLVVPVIINGNVSGMIARREIEWVMEKQMSPAAALFGAGVGTLIYLLITKKKSPVFLGSSFAFLGSMTSAFAGAATMAVGYLGLILGAIIAGLVYVVIAIIVKGFGTKWIEKIMPAVVIGPTVAIIGLSLAGNAVGDLTTGVTEKPLATYLAILCGLVTLAVLMLCSVYGKKSAKLIPFIYGIIAGYIFALILTIAAILSKLIGCGFGAYVNHFKLKECLQIGVGMVSRGEVALIVAEKGRQFGLVSSKLFGPIVLVVIATTLITPIGLKMVFAESGEK